MKLIAEMRSLEYYACRISELGLELRELLLSPAARLTKARQIAKLAALAGLLDA